MKDILFELTDVTYAKIINIKHMIIHGNMTTCIIGQSGAGKTTLLRLLNKLISPNTGEIRFKDTPLSSIESTALRKQVVMLSQQPIMFEKTIQDNLTIGCVFAKKEIPTQQQLQDMMQQLSLSKSLSNDASKCSIGEKQRIALGRVLLMDADVYLMDEPSSSLDVQTEQLIMDVIVKYTKSKGHALIMVTHSEKVANTYGDRIIDLHKEKTYG